MSEINKNKVLDFLDNTLNKVVLNPLSILSKVKPRNFTTDVLFKDIIKKDKKAQIGLKKVKKVSNLLSIELKNQIKKKRFNMKNFKSIIDELDLGILKVIVEVICLIIIFVYFKTYNFKDFFLTYDIVSLFNIVIFPLFILNLYHLSTLFLEEMNRNSDLVSAAKKIKTYYDSLQKNDLSFFELTQSVYTMMIFAIIIYIIFCKVLLINNFFNDGLGIILYFLLKVISVISLSFNIRILIKMKKEQNRNKIYNDTDIEPQTT